MKILQIVLAVALAAPVFGSPVPGNGLYSGISEISTKSGRHHHLTKHTKHAKHTKHTKCTKTVKPTPSPGTATPSVGPTTTAFTTITTTTTITTVDAPSPTDSGSVVSTSPSGALTGFSTSLVPIAVTSTSSSDTASSVTIQTTVAPSVTTSTASAPSASAASSSSPDGMLRGVNVGNWLILEKFMDDGTVFTGKYSSASDQWSYDEIDTDGADIQSHWSSWFTESDVQKLASAGFNALRIPIGYWAFDNSNTPYTKGAADYLDKAIGWARTSGMKVLVDCHGSPGSQNGQEHSGHSGAVDWQQDDNLEWSTQVLQTMIKRYGGQNNSDVVWGLETVNEPTASEPNSFSKSQSWATEAYSALQATIFQNSLNPKIQIITHDSFMGPTKFVSLLSDVKSPVQAPTFGVDQHNYQLYTDTDNAKDQPAHIQDACSWSDALSQTKQSMPVIVGEWSALTNICVKSDGSTYGSSSCDGSGNCATCSTDTWTPALVEQVRKYVEAQLDTFEANSNGHFAWNFKAGKNSGWSVYDLMTVKAFPSPITDRQYSPQCS